MFESVKKALFIRGTSADSGESEQEPRMARQGFKGSARKKNSIWSKRSRQSNVSNSMNLGEDGMPRLFLMKERGPIERLEYLEPSIGTAEMVAASRDMTI